MACGSSEIIVFDWDSSLEDGIHIMNAINKYGTVSNIVVKLGTASNGITETFHN